MRSFSLIHKHQNNRIGQLIRIIMSKIAIAVHGGAGPDSEFIKKNIDGYKKGLEEAVNAGYRVLEEGGSSLDAVEEAVNYLEDNPLFNAGRGSALNEKAEHIYIGDMGALEFAQKIGLKVMPEAYFITDHAYEEYLSALKDSENTIEGAGDYQVKRKTHGTVGAVALDREGNLAAATSTGGTENKVPGRIGDSSMI